MEILLGHLVGDYLLQNRKMALNKSKKGASGLYWCLLHCMLYTTSICVAMQTMTPTTISPLIAVLVFMSHFPIDRWSLANYWVKLIGDKTIRVLDGSEDGDVCRFAIPAQRGIVYVELNGNIDRTFAGAEVGDGCLEGNVPGSGLGLAQFG